MNDASRISVIYPYYGNRTLLDMQYEVWSGLPRHMRERIDFIVVDDGSPTPIRYPSRAELNLGIFRIHADIPWNIPGAKNLGVLKSRTEWVLVSDIDHMLTAEAAEKLLKLDTSNPKVYYGCEREFPGGTMAVTDSMQKTRRNIPATLIINQRLFIDAGGFDEDFSGSYGKDDSMLKWHLEANVGCRRRESGVVLLCYASRYDEANIGARDSSRNTRLFEQKKREQNYRPKNPIRFDWSLVAECRIGR